MHPENHARLLDYCQEHHLVAALLSSPFSLTWLTGYAPPIQTGPSPFEGGPALAWVRGQEITLVLSDAEAGAARQAGVSQVCDYLAYTIEAPLAGMREQAAALRQALEGQASLTGAVGVELNFLAAPLAQVLAEALPQARLEPLDGKIETLRAVKTPAEVQKIRQALALCDLAQEFVRDHAAPGLSEIALWGQLKARLENQAGARLPVLADLVGGLRSAEIGGLPGRYILQTGDAVIADMVVRLDGYWGDNAATHFLGEPPAELAQARRLVSETLERGLAALRPGLRASQLDALLRDAIQEGGFSPHPHHSGHGIGASFHEEPRIVAYNELPLEAGMVVALEPGVYLPGVGGVRLEQVALVEADGCQVLTHHLD
jgi:Xaa-Pro dipeptidase